MLAIILGTRPELIKCAPVILELQRRRIPFGIIHTGQHYSHEMDGRFFEELDLPAPVAHIHTGSCAAPVQIGLMMQRLSDALSDFHPDRVLIEGDTNSALAGALTAHKLGIPVIQLEGGFRSDDWTMPEECNRVLADRLATWVFCASDDLRDRLAKEGITHDGVHVVGSTIVDAIEHYAMVSKEKSSVLQRFGLSEEPYALLTMHRPSNVDDPERLRSMLHVVHLASSLHGLKMVFPVHPRTKHVMDEHRLVLGEAFVETEPLGYLDMLRLQSSARLVLTDSGGIQGEACTLRVPAITLRPNTEYLKTLEIGANILFSDLNPNGLAEAMRVQLGVERSWVNPLGDGKAAMRVLDCLYPGSKRIDDSAVL